MIWRSIRAALVGVALGTPLSEASGQSAAATFERLKSLAGTWEISEPGAERVRIEYQLGSGGSAVLERVVGPAEHGPAGMISIFYLEGDRIGMSHFCTAGNQPRFGSTSVGDTVRFALVAGSVADPAMGHIHEVEFRFGRDGQLETVWTWYDDGRPNHQLIRRQSRVSPGG
jgi:hypothetical protein